MDNEKLAMSMILNVLEYYDSIGGYRLIPNNHEICYGHPGVRLLDPNPVFSSTMGFYRMSLTLDRQFISSSSGLPAESYSWGLPNVFKCLDSQGIMNARIIAHICTWGDSFEHAYAYVARWEQNHNVEYDYL